MCNVEASSSQLELLSAQLGGPGVQQARWNDGVLTLRVGSGQYDFRVPSASAPSQPVASRR